MIPQKNPLIASGESVHANMLTKLWENPTPSASFAPQDINLSSDDYDFTYWDVLYSASGYHLGYIVPKGTSVIFTFGGTTGSSYTINAQRNVPYTNDTKYSAGQAFIQNSNGARTQDNAILVPLAVYGFKKSLDITAIVSNVSTDASKCMLSDGVTSVADVIDGGSVSVTADGSKTWSQLLNSLYALINSSKLTAWSYISLSTGIIFPISNKGATQFDFGAMTIRNLNAMRVKSSSSEFTAFNIETKTYTDNSSSVATSGTVITLHY